MIQERWTAVQRFLELIAEHSRLEATAIQTVGAKGYDGFVMAILSDDPLAPDAPAQ